MVGRMAACLFTEGLPEVEVFKRESGEVLVFNGCRRTR
jgi:hypothetical protein